MYPSVLNYGQDMKREYVGEVLREVLRSPSENAIFSQVVIVRGNIAGLTPSPTWVSEPGKLSESPSRHIDQSSLSFLS